ncbi:hypothetical protein, conserved [Eimeria tenella]|uniref:Thiamin pyrophosphokinase catalytic domain-containing protein n=1 Tax=Eimeria tenella TaxID=5802 RepID=U6KMY4_EIMTE|nr:hypothetical protein, conserved [Eimeria tenella]CDJ39432.1 hypothetical protein, conserved [Eimeria tenella]|eukprot:XP_013230187.1 hypothetical protein, conserved [Eimeria tenella]
MLPAARGAFVFPFRPQLHAMHALRAPRASACKPQGCCSAAAALKPPAAAQQRRSHSSSSSSSSGPTHILDLRFLEALRPGSAKWKAVPPAPAAAAATAEAAAAAAAPAAAAAEAGRVVLLVLNRPLPPYFKALLQQASLVLAADGAANHLRHIYEQQQQQQQLQLQQQQQRGRAAEDCGAGAAASGVRTLQWPACICGDLDSLKEEVKYNNNYNYKFN